MRLILSVHLKSKSALLRSSTEKAAKNQGSNRRLERAILPILLIYPFVQKYLVRGVVVGAVKG